MIPLPIRNDIESISLTDSDTYPPHRGSVLKHLPICNPPNHLKKLIDTDTDLNFLGITSVIISEPVVQLTREQLDWINQVMDLLMGRFRGAVPENSPFAVMGRFPSLMARFPSLIQKSTKGAGRASGPQSVFPQNLQILSVRFPYNSLEKIWLPKTPFWWAVLPLKNPRENSPLRKGPLRGSWSSWCSPSRCKP